MKTSVRLLAVLFALLMSLFVVSAVAFDDVQPTHKHYEAIELLTSLGIINGYEDGTFKPDEPVERDEMAKMIFIMATAFYDAGNGTQTFPDVPDGQWAEGFISWCYSKDVVGGYEDGTFRPDDNITYDEALKMVATMLGYTDFDSELWPADVRTVALKQLNLGENMPDDLQGDTYITRAQAAQLLYNAFYKSMATTKTETYYEDGYVDADGNPVKKEVKVQVAMTLAEDVWDFSITDYTIVATENYAVNDQTRGLLGTTKTGKDDTIKLWDGVSDALITVSLEDLGLSSYKGNTDFLIGFTLSKVTKDGKDFKMSGIKGARYDNVSVNWVSATASTAGAWHSGSTYWCSDRIMLNGELYSDDNFWNLRTVYVAKDATDTTFNVMNMPIAFADQFNSPSQTWDTPLGTFMGTTASSAPFILSEVHINDYRANGYSTKLVWAVDSEGDGVIDYVFLKYVMPYIVTEVTDVVVSGQKDQLITYADLYSSANTHTVYKSDVIFSSELKVGDIFTAATIADNLYVEMVVQPQVTNLTSITNGGKPTFAGVEVSSIGENFLDLAAATVKDSIFNTSDASYWLSDNADGTVRELKVWVYKNKLIYTTAYDASAAAESNGYNKAILLYVDKKTDKQLDLSTNKFVEFYPAYILVNGKEEAINLNPDNAIDGASAAYVSADGSPYRAQINSDSTLGFLYKLVTYTVDANGYYTLCTVNDDLVDPTSGDLIEMVIPASDHPKLQYNDLTGYYKLVTDSGTFGSIDIDDDTILYYNYTKAATGEYKYIAFYTSDNMVSGKINEIAFNSDVYLTYNAEDDFYILDTALLAGKLETVTGGTASSVIDPNKDGRVVYFATEDSAAVALNGKAYYEHTFMNVATGETFTVVQDKMTIADGATKALAGSFYAWIEATGDYAIIHYDDLDSVSYGDYVTSVNVARGLIFDTDAYIEGLKLPDGVKIIAFDNDLNRHELTLSEYADLVEYSQSSAPGAIAIYVTYIDEAGDTQLAYILTTYLEKNGSTTTHHTDVAYGFLI